MPCSALEVLSSALEVLGGLLKVFHVGGAMFCPGGGLLKVFHVGGAGCCAGGAFRVGAVLGDLLKVFHGGGAEFCARDVVCCAGGAVLYVWREVLEAQYCCVWCAGVAVLY